MVQGHPGVSDLGGWTSVWEKSPDAAGKPESSLSTLGFDDGGGDDFAGDELERRGTVFGGRADVGVYRGEPTVSATGLSGLAWRYAKGATEGAFSPIVQ